MKLGFKQQLEGDLLKSFGFAPTHDQAKALNLLAGFCLSLSPNEVFILTGYAGTGKTSLVKSLVKSLPNYKRKVVLLAPTGRAAKVMAQYSYKKAFTIHKYIYRPKKSGGEMAQFSLRENNATNTLFVVDEASMIGDSGHDASLSSGSLLQDLFQFVRNGVNCKLLLVGDDAQLPPVGSEKSPALQSSYLELQFGSHCTEVQLQEVMRQTQDSQVLQNATQIRAQIANQQFWQPQFLQGKDAIRLVEGYEVEDALNESFSEVGREGTAVLVRSNKRAGLYNQQIRARILWQEDEISAGDFLMVVKNNYFWLPDSSKASFIANGDTIELLQIFELIELYGYRFARAKVQMVDYPDEAPFECHLLLNTLDMPTPALPWEEAKLFYQKVLEDYPEIKSKYKKHQEVQKNPFFNALQVKFAYAITCHKAQGGQWQNVFVEKPWQPTDDVDVEYLRWLYTACTRAQKKLYFIGFPDANFIE